MITQQIIQQTRAFARQDGFPIPSLDSVFYWSHASPQMA